MLVMSVRNGSNVIVLAATVRFFMLITGVRAVLVILVALVNSVSPSTLKRHVPAVVTLSRK